MKKFVDQFQSQSAQSSVSLASKPTRSRFFLVNPAGRKDRACMPGNQTAQQRLADNAPSFQNRLIAWYDAQARDLPWRREPTLYKTVVSEFMLQQTQVKTVLPYFARWMERFPDFAALAEATEEEVLKRWEGLGYYSRARNLHKLAQLYVATPIDKRPTTAVNWLSFPGVGPYAAAAICSIAFGDAAAVIDGNVVRILARLCADQSSYANSSEAAKNYRPLAAALLNVERPGDHNQAMMELGATVCQKSNPQCLICPVRPHCQGQEAGIEADLPRFEKTNFENRTVARVWVHGPKGILLYKIPATSKRMKGLHELPSLEQLGQRFPEETLSAAPLLERKRSITRYRITERIYALHPNGLRDTLPEHCLWASPKQLDTLPFSGPHRRWIEELRQLT